MIEMIRRLEQYQSDCVDAFFMEVSEGDIKNNPDALKLAKRINRQGRWIDIALWLLEKTNN